MRSVANLVHLSASYFCARSSNAKITNKKGENLHPSCFVPAVPGQHNATALHPAPIGPRFATSILRPVPQRASVSLSFIPIFRKPRIRKIKQETSDKRTSRSSQSVILRHLRFRATVWLTGCTDYGLLLGCDFTRHIQKKYTEDREE